MIEKTNTDIYLVANKKFLSYEEALKYELEQILSPYLPSVGTSYVVLWNSLTKNFEKIKEELAGAG